MKKVSIHYSDDTTFETTVKRVDLVETYVYLTHPDGKREVIPLANVYSIAWIDLKS